MVIHYKCNVAIFYQKFKKFLLLVLIYATDKCILFLIV